MAAANIGGNPPVLAMKTAGSSSNLKSFTKAKHEHFGEKNESNP
jgi:hypothetical protein